MLVFPRLLLAIALGTSLDASGAAAQKRPLSKEQLVGSWRLVSMEARSSSGLTTAQYGPNPAGRLMYDRGGRMSVHLVDPRIKGFASGDPLVASPAELQAAVSGYFGYFGTYAVDGASGTVTHYVEGASFPNYAGTVQKRFVHLSGDRLVLTTPPQLEGGEQLTTSLVWARER